MAFTVAPSASAFLATIRAINETSEFNRWCGIVVESAEPGKVEISMPWRVELGQYAGFLHAGVVGALIDTACGFAAATLVGRVPFRPPLRWLRAQGVLPRFLSVSSVWDGTDSTLMFLYGRLRICVVERLAGIAPIFFGGARRSIRDALAAGETVYGLVDVPAKPSGDEAANARLLCHAMRLPTGILESVRGSHRKVVVLTSRVDASGKRAIDLVLFDDGDTLTIDTLALSLECRLRAAAPAWHFWNLWSAFRA